MRRLIFAWFILVLMIAGCKKEKSEDNMAETDKMMKAEEVSLSGYAMDTICGTSGKGMDGSNVSQSPQDHTKHCLEVCKAGGFGIMTKAAGEDYYTYTPFDEEGSNQVFELIEKSAKDKGIQISVTGTFSDGVITVASIMEK